MTDAMEKIAANAQYFEDRAPWDPRYKEAGREAACGEGGGDASWRPAIST